jgi:hypothetical protein
MFDPYCELVFGFYDREENDMPFTKALTLEDAFDVLQRHTMGREIGIDEARKAAHTLENKGFNAEAWQLQQFVAISERGEQ